GPLPHAYRAPLPAPSVRPGDRLVRRIPPAHRGVAGGGHRRHLRGTSLPHRGGAAERGGGRSVPEGDEKAGPPAVAPVLSLCQGTRITGAGVEFCWRSLCRTAAPQPDDGRAVLRAARRRLSPSQSEEPELTPIAVS